MPGRAKRTICSPLRRRPVGQAVKTAASHAANMGSIPVRVTNFKIPLDIPRKSVIILTVEKAVRREKCDVFFAYFLFKRKVQLVLIRARVHPFPFRTRKLSSLLPKILVWRRTGKIGSAYTKQDS